MTIDCSELFGIANEFHWVIIYSLQTDIIFGENSFTQQIFTEYLLLYGRHKKCSGQDRKAYVFIDLPFLWGYIDNKQENKYVKKIIADSSKYNEGNRTKSKDGERLDGLP